MRKSTRLAALATALLLTVASPASAAVNVQLNGQPLTFDVAPVVDNGRTLVPVRAIFEALGARITWDPATETVSAVHPEREKYVILKLGSTTAWVDGVEVTLDVPPKAVDGRTMVPLRFISTAMGADVAWDPATETAIITQEPLPSEEPVVEEPVTEEPVTEEPFGALTLSQYTRAIAYTHLDETMLCTWGSQGRFDDFDYLFTNEDPEYFADSMQYLGESILCWEIYESSLLADLTPPTGAEKAHAALQQWVNLNVDALRQIGEASRAQTGGDTAERDRLFAEAKQLYAAAGDQELVMLAAMYAITSPATDFMTVAEHQYFAWLDDMMGATDNCFYQLNMIGEEYDGEFQLTDAELAQGAADCWAEMPSIIGEEEPPTPRMQALRQAANTELTLHAASFNALAAKLEAGALTGEALETAIAETVNPWFEESIPALQELFGPYRTYGAN